MRRVVILACAAALAACGKTETKAPDTTKAAPPPPAPIKLADVAGKWSMKAMNEAGDSTLVTYDLVATADTAGWTITFPGRKPVPAHVEASGDSLTIDAGPYESVLRKGVKVTTHTVSRLKDGKLVGTSVAHYSVKTADSVRNIRSEGTKAP